MRIFSDGPGRHIVCYPYSIENLHVMARELDLKPCWFHPGRLAHYDMPKKRIAEITARTEVVTGIGILSICKGNAPPFVARPLGMTEIETLAWECDPRNRQVSRSDGT